MTACLGDDEGQGASRAAAQIKNTACAANLEPGNILFEVFGDLFAYLIIVALALGVREKLHHGLGELLPSPEATAEMGRTNPQEFFAEMTESYFGSNDFYPFVTGELKQAEPEIFTLMEELWGPLPGREKRKAPVAAKIEPGAAQPSAPISK